MPLWIGFAVKGGVILAGVLLLFFGIRWIFKRGQEHQAERDTRERLKGGEEARKREAEIAEAARKVREAGGPVVPDLDELQRGAGGKTPPP